MPMTPRTGRCWLTGAVLLSVLPFGCSGGGFGEAVRFSVRETAKADALISAGERVHFPNDEPFSVANAQRHSQGSGRADSQASPDGKARCSAAIAGMGEATGEFQLGHIIFNAQDQPLPVTVAFDCAYHYQSSRSATGKVPESIGLKFYVKDSNRHVLRRDVLVAPDGVLGATEHSSRQAASFDLTLQPGLAYQLILAGIVRTAEETEPTELEAAVEVQEFSITVSAH